MTEKLERLLKSGVEVAHIGVCSKKRDGTICTHMLQTADWLETHGIKVLWGTH